MKHLFKMSLALIAAVLLISSCKKDDEKTRTEIITGSTCWKLSKIEEKDGGVYVDVTSSDYDPCELDDCARFNADGTYILNDSGEKCTGSTDPIEEGTWSLSNSDQTLTIIADGFPIVATIESISESQMVITFNIFGTDIRGTYKN